MAGKVVSIKIGYNITNVAEVDHEARNPKVYHAFAMETPDGVLSDDGVHVTEEFVTQFKKGMSENGIQNNRAIFTISSSRVANRDVTIPLVKEAKIRPLLIANVKDYFPVDLSKYQLVYRVNEVKRAEKKIDLTVYAVPNTLVDSYQALAKNLGLQLVAMDYFGNSIYHAMMHSMSPELSATICIEDNSSVITVIQNGKAVLQRSIGYGIEDAVDTMRESTLVPKGTGYLKALSAMHQNVCFNEQLKAVSEDEDPATAKEGAQSVNAKENITHSLSLLIGNISRVLDYFASRHSEVELNEITLVGLGADCKGLDTLLSNELGVKVVSAHKFGNTDITRSLSAKSFHLGEYYACIGCAIQPLQFALASLEKKSQHESMLVPILVCGGCVLVSIAILLTGAITNMALGINNRKTTELIDSKRGVVDDYNKYVETKTINGGMVIMDASSKVPNDAFLDFLEEMETKLPSDMIVSNLSVSDSTISFSATCASKESAADILMQLRTFSTVFNIQCSGITEETDESGATKVYMDVSLTYLGLTTEQSEGGEE